VTTAAMGDAYLLYQKKKNGSIAAQASLPLWKTFKGWDLEASTSTVFSWEYVFGRKTCVEIKCKVNRPLPTAETPNTHHGQTCH